MTRCNTHAGHRRGTAIIAALLCLMVVSLITASLVETVIVHDRQFRQQQRQLQALWLAQAALQQAQLQRQLDPDYTGGTLQMPADQLHGTHAAVVHTRVVQAGSDARIEVEAIYPDDPRLRVLHREEVIFSDEDSGEAS